MPVSNSPLVSVVIPTYNRAFCIAATVQSVLDQTFRDFELIVVDDGSTDGTAEILQEFGTSIKVLTISNSGLAAARNQGLALAQGRYIALNDSDDLWLPDKLGLQVAAMEANPSLMVHLTDARLQREHLEQEVTLWGHAGIKAQFDHGALILERPLQHHIRHGLAWVQCALIRAELVRSTGGYDENLKIFTDLEWFSRLALGGPWALSLDCPVVIKRFSGEANVSARRKEDPAYANGRLVYIYRKLLRRTELLPAEREVIRQKLESAQSGLIYTLIDTGSWTGAVRNASALAGTVSRVRNFAKLFLALLPPPIGRKMLTVLR